MTEIVPEGDRRRMGEITEYLNRELAAPDGRAPAVHVHYHAAPQPPAAPPAEQSPGQEALDRAVPYFVMLLGGVVILACVAVIAVMLVPALISLAVTCAIVMGGFALVSLSIAAAVRSLRQSRAESKVIGAALARKGRRGR
jgi:hypothetical protein